MTLRNVCYFENKSCFIIASLTAINQYFSGILKIIIHTLQKQAHIIIINYLRIYFLGLKTKFTLYHIYYALREQVKFN